jgi:cytidyltransferase-like protein
MKVVATSGYFNPLHRGHIALLRAARALGDHLIVIINNDDQVRRKGSQAFMGQEERAELVRAIRYVDDVRISFDYDSTVNRTLQSVNPDIFAKGGDSVEENTPEVRWCRDNGKQVVFGVGGGKIQSSSWLKKQPSLHAE